MRVSISRDPSLLHVSRSQSCSSSHGSLVPSTVHYAIGLDRVGFIEPHMGSLQGSNLQPVGNLLVHSPFPNMQKTARNLFLVWTRNPVKRLLQNSTAS